MAGFEGDLSHSEDLEKHLSKGAGWGSSDIEQTQVAGTRGPGATASVSFASKRYRFVTRPMPAPAQYKGQRSSSSATLTVGSSKSKHRMPKLIEFLGQVNT